MFTIRAARFTFELRTERGELKIMNIEDRLRIINTKWRKPHDKISFERNIRNLFVSENRNKDLPSRSKSLFLSISFLNALFLKIYKNLGTITFFYSFFDTVATTDFMSMLFSNELFCGEIYLVWEMWERFSSNLAFYNFLSVSLSDSDVKLLLYYLSLNYFIYENKIKASYFLTVFFISIILK